MSYLFNVYSHPQKGQWGFTGVQDGKIMTAFVDGRDQQVTLEAIEPIKMAPKLSRLTNVPRGRNDQPPIYPFPLECMAPAY